MRKKVIIHLYLIGGFFSICSAIYFGYYYFFYLPAIAQSPDAIAVRVYQNQDHQSALAWYQAKGFAGSPQALSVDGYDAIRDGRTVYVHAANIDLGSDPIIQTDDIYYSNIYLISYNQQAEADTKSERCSPIEDAGPMYDEAVEIADRGAYNQRDGVGLEEVDQESFDPHSCSLHEVVAVDSPRGSL